MFDLASIKRVAEQNPYTEGTLKLAYLEVGALLRPEFRRLVAQTEAYGGSFTFREHKFLLSTIYAQVRISGEAWLLYQVASNITNWSREDD